MLRRLWERYSPTLTVLAVIAVIAGMAMHWGIITTTANHVGLIGQAAYRAYKWDQALDRLPEYKIWDAPEEIFSEQRPMEFWGITTNSRQLARWTLEIVPYWEREGIVETAVYPTVAAYVPGPCPRYHFQIAGRAAPHLGVYHINYRYYNPASPWVDRSELGTIVHELGHIQGIATMDPLDVMEASNQVATLEVLAAMANDGNYYATQALLKDLRGMAMGYLRTELREANLGWLYSFYARNVIYNTFEERAAGERGARFWADKQDDLDWLIHAYSATPYRWAMASVQREDNMSRPLLLGPSGEYWRIELDDLDYFLRHTEQHVRAALRK